MSEQGRGRGRGGRGRGRRNGEGRGGRGKVAPRSSHNVATVQIRAKRSSLGLAEKLAASIKRSSLGMAEKLATGVQSWVTSDADRTAVTKRLEQLKRHQNGLFRDSARWDLLMILLLLFTATVTPFEACFMTTKGFDALFFVNRIVDLGFVLDMFRQFNTIIYDKNGEMVCDRRKIAHAYVKGWFLIDIISIFPVPFDVIASAQAEASLNNPEVQAKSSMKVMRFTRLLRIMKLTRVIRATRIIARWETASTLSFSFMSVTKQLVLVFMLIHWNACLWYFAATISDPDAGPTWVSNLKVEEYSAGRQYLLSMYNSVTILYGGSCADHFQPNTDEEYITAILLQSMGALCYAYVLGGIVEYISTKDPATGDFNSRIDGINLFMKEERIPTAVRTKTREFFRHAKAVIRSRYFNKSLGLISNELRGELIANMRHGWLHRIKFFRNLPEDEKMYFIGSIASNLELKTVAQSELVIRSGEFRKELYIVHAGLVGLFGRVLGQGQIIGEDMILNLVHPTLSRRHYAALALTYVQLYVLQNEGLVLLLQEDNLKRTKEVMRRNALKLVLSRNLVEAAQNLAHVKSVRQASAKPAGYTRVGVLSGIGDNSELKQKIRQVKAAVEAAAEVGVASSRNIAEVHDIASMQGDIADAQGSLAKLSRLICRMKIPAP